MTPSAPVRDRGRGVDRDGLRRQRDEAARVADLVELRLDALRDLRSRARRAPRRLQGGADRSSSPAGRVGRAADSTARRMRGCGLLERRHPAGRRVGGRRVARGSCPPGSTCAAGGGSSCPRTNSRRCRGTSSERYRAMRATGAEVVKLAVTARTLGDCLPLLDLGREAARRGRAGRARRDGRRGRAHAPASRLLRVVLVVRR